MKVNRPFSWVFLLLVASSCATPIGPTGGPPDKSPLAVIATYPASGTTNFTGDRVLFKFDDFPERSSLSQAVKVVPDGLKFRVIPGKKSVVVKFESPLPEETTIQVILGTTAMDFRRNKMERSEIIAFSTGSTIDGGKLAGRIYPSDPSYKPGNPVAALWREEDSLYARPRYAVQPDSLGAFQFEYVKNGEYRLLWFYDRNRNFRFDAGEEAAADADAALVSVDTTLGPARAIYMPSIRDTIPPQLQAIGVFSRERLRLRFNKPLTFNEYPTLLFLTSNGNQIDTAVALFDTEGKQVVMAQTLRPMVQGQMYRLQIPVWFSADSAACSFSGIAQNDTTLFGPVRIVNGKFQEERESLNVLYSKFDARNLPADSVKLFVNETREKNVQIQSRYNLLQIRPAGGWKPDISYEVRLFIPATGAFVKHKPVIGFEERFGSIEADSATVRGAGWRYLAFDRSRNLRYEGELPSSRLVKLPEGTWFVRLFNDVNRNSIWDSGTIAPWRAPEPIQVFRNVKVKTDFTTVLGELEPAEPERVGEQRD